MATDTKQTVVIDVDCSWKEILNGRVPIEIDGDVDLDDPDVQDRLHELIKDEFKTVGQAGEYLFDTAEFMDSENFTVDHVHESTQDDGVITVDKEELEG